MFTRRLLIPTTIALFASIVSVSASVGAVDLLNTSASTPMARVGSTAIETTRSERANADEQSTNQDQPNGSGWRFVVYLAVLIVVNCGITAGLFLIASYDRIVASKWG